MPLSSDSNRIWICFNDRKVTPKISSLLSPPWTECPIPPSRSPSLFQPRFLLFCLSLSYWYVDTPVRSITVTIEAVRMANANGFACVRLAFGSCGIASFSNSFAIFVWMASVSHMQTNPWLLSGHALVSFIAPLITSILFMSRIELGSISKMRCGVMAQNSRLPKISAFPIAICLVLMNLLSSLDMSVLLM